MKGTKKIAQALIEQKVKHIFGLPGGSIMPLYDELMNHESEIRHVLVRHEQAAAHAADAYARVKEKTGVCMTTSGPGATNIVTGLMSAYMDSVPLVAISGNVPTKRMGKNSFQETDMVSITKAITKYNYQIKNANEINSAIKNAFHISKRGRPGPVFLDLPKDVQIGEVNEEKNIPLPKFGVFRGKNGEKIKEAAKMILNAEKPVVLAGGGVIISNASKELTELAEGLNLPVVTTFMGKSCFPEEHPLCLGVLGMHGRKIANYAIDNADVILNIGCRFSDRITGNTKTFAKNAKIIHIDIDAKEIGKNVEVALPIVGDAQQILQQLNKVIITIAKKGNNEWSKKMKQLNKECSCDININSKPIDPRKVMLELNNVLRKEDIVTTGTGQHQMFAAHFIKRSFPRTIVSSGGSGTMGYGFPASIGAKIAKPEVEAIDIDGDGSFAMVLQELATCKEEEIKTIPVILNNSYLGMVRQWQELFFDKRYAQTHLKRTPNFAKVAEAYNLNGISVERPSEIKEALEQAYKNEETTVLDIKIGEETNILPMFGSGANNIDMFGGCIQTKGKLF